MRILLGKTSHNNFPQVKISISGAKLFMADLSEAKLKVRMPAYLTFQGQNDWGYYFRC